MLVEEAVVLAPSIVMVTVTFVPEMVPVVV